MSLLSYGPASVRKIAKISGLNRGTAYDILRSLKDIGLVAHFNKEKKQYFVTEDPQRIESLFKQKEEEIKAIKEDIADLVRELKSQYDSGGKKPAVRLYEGKKGIKAILEDVLSTMSRQKTADGEIGKEHEIEYYVYSPQEVRTKLYDGFEDYNRERISRGISVKTIALGRGGGLFGKDERKWIPSAKLSRPTYTLIYNGKVAHIFLDAGKNLSGVIIENKGIFETQKFLFLELWKKI